MKNRVQQLKNFKIKYTVCFVSWVTILPFMSPADPGDVLAMVGVTLHHQVTLGSVRLADLK